jgi:ketosteroid isomerase-like protein
MSGDNVELVRSICSAWARGDYGSAEWAHPEIEFVIADGPAPGRWSGLAGMAEGWRTWLGAWEDFHQEADEYRELDGERVLVYFRGSGRAKTTGLALEQISQRRAAGLFHVVAGKVTRFAVYLDRESAVAELGIASSRPGGRPERPPDRG